MLYKTTSHAGLFNTDLCTTLARLQPGDTPSLIQEYCLAAGYTYHRVLFNGQIGYIHTRLLQPLKTSPPRAPSRAPSRAQPGGYSVGAVGLNGAKPV